MPIRNYFYFHLFIFVIIVLFTEEIWPNSLLLIAQLVFIPVLFLAILDRHSTFKKMYPFIAIPTYVAVAWMSIFPSELDGVFAVFYFIFTLYIALYGIHRFFLRGFIHIEEFIIDIGLLSLPIGGIWLIAYTFDINTGFTPIITWLTAIHFHYSACIMLIFIGLLGRVSKRPTYLFIAPMMALLPWVMAIGITISPWIELVGIIFYILTVFMLFYYSLQTVYIAMIQKIFVSVSFFSICITICFASLYVLTTGFHFQLVTIDWMLIFHGFTNAVLFGFIGTVGWLMSIPSSRWQAPTFPLSPIRNKFKPKEADEKLNGLVDHMELYEPFINRQTVAKTIVDFYENTNTFTLKASIQWSPWFKPFAFIYRQLSRLLEQINLPISSKQVEMTGNIYRVDEGNHGRNNVRAWVRKIKEEIVFVALYSTHSDGIRTYMNIALPLPFTSMHGILAFIQHGEKIELTSVRKDETMNDVGIYLAFGKNGYFRLPLTETFHLQEISPGKLHATHRMHIFKLPFLKITYNIMQNKGST